MSYRKKHVKSRINRIRPRKSIFKKLWFWILLLIIIIIGAVLYTVLFYSGFQVKNILISGNEKVGTQDLQNFATTGVNTKILDFLGIKINSRSIFLVNENNLGKEALQKFPQIENVNINKKFPQTLELGVAERKPVGVFCPSAGASTELSRMSSGQAREECFLIDNNGIIYESVTGIPQNMIALYQTPDVKSLSDGSDVVQKNIMDDILKIQKDLKDNFQIDLADAMISNPLRLDVKTKDNWQIYFDTETGSDINAQITRLNLLLNGDITPGVRKTLQYIDLRFKDRAFYK